MRNCLVRLASGVALAASCLWGGVAHAQQIQSQQGLQQMGSDASLGLAYIPLRGNVADSGGVKLSESTVLHTGVGFEAGYDTNVFFQSSQNKTAAPVVRVIPFLQFTNAARGGARPNGAFYDLTATLLYREFVTDNENAQAQRAFNPVVTGLVEFSPNSPLRLSVMDTFSRFEEPPYGSSSGNITRINNLGSLQLAWQPGGGRLQALIRYSNMVNVFENNDLKYANHMGHDLTLDVSWRWLPKTSLFLQASQGYIDYFDPNANGPQLLRQDAYPLRVLTGLRGLITNKTTLYLGVGYINGFYQGNVENPSGFSNLGFVSEVSYSPNPLTRLILGFRHEFRNSPVVGNFYDVDSPYASINWMLANRIMWSAFARYEYRQYQGSGALLPGQERRDNVFQAGTQADLYVSHWFYIGASYIATVNDSNYSEILGLENTAGLDYVKHLVLGRLGVTY